jgi:hypothetical protein
MSRHKEERNKRNRIAIAVSIRAAISFSSQPKAYQDQIATLSKEDCLTQRSQNAKKNAIKGTGWYKLRAAISFSSQPKAYQHQIATLSKEESLTQRSQEAKKKEIKGTGLR